MEGNLYSTGGAVNLSNGENVKDFQISDLPRDKIFSIEFVGINGFAQQDQILFVSLEVTNGDRAGTYPIVLTGSSPFGDPAYPKRVFGSQQVALRATPNTSITVSVARNNTHNEARILFELAGRVFPPAPST
ncbi:MAG: hypothetical protein QM715_00680 [Nibricoccus sp.]